eukprot:gene34263-57006_t
MSVQMTSAMPAPDKSGACRVFRISRSSLHYRSIKDDSTIIKHLEDLAEDHSLEGFWKYYHRIRNQGVVVTHKRLHRIYKDLKLPL